MPEKQESAKKTIPGVHEPLGFNDIRVGRAMLDEVKNLLGKWQEKHGRPLALMEVCGTHTVAFSRSGIRDALRSLINLKSGPGCPVCVTDQEDIDYMLALATEPNVTIATFGDMIRVPGSRGDLARARAEGAKVQVVYSPLDAIALAQSEPDRQIVFLGIGFETTVPTVAAALAQAEGLGLTNFSIYSVHKLAAPVIIKLLEDPELQLDGLILPGHVSAITGRRHFDFVAEKYAVPSAVAGFDTLDLLSALKEITLQLLNEEARVANCYQRVVSEHGNSKAWRLVERFFVPSEAKWRGLGSIPGSGLILAPLFAAFDARHRFPLTLPTTRIPTGCLCGEVLKGKSTPFNCKLFAKACNPVHPVGPCMVSGEGTCAAYYKYERRDGVGDDRAVDG